MINLPLLIVVLAALLVVLALGSWLVRKNKRRNLNTDYFRARWKELSTLCDDAKTWPLAVINADKLVDEALKKCHYKGKTMGERLVSAQHDLKANDAIWFGHKLRNKLVHENYKLNGKKELKDALLGFLDALKDLGAIK